MLTPLADLSTSMHVLGFVTASALYVMLGVMAWQQRVGGQSVNRLVEPTTLAWHAPRLFAVALLGLTLSVAGNLLHLNTAMYPAATAARLPRWILVCGYAALMGLIAVPLWGGTTKSRVLALVAILVFALSALHFAIASNSESLAVELVVHYAPLPLVATLLYQEYRFALADVFLKRALTLILLVAIAASLLSLAHALESQSAVLLFWIGTALVYPVLRYVVYTGVDRVILRRVPARELRARLAREIAIAETPDIVLNQVSTILQDAFTARWVQWNEEEPRIGTAHATPDSRGASLRVHIPVADTPTYIIGVGPLAGGRRLLSEDIEVLDVVALDVARRIDVLRITSERYERSTREAEALRLAAESELRALHAQLNPHFLFNALTTIGYLIQTTPDRALTTLLRLTDLLRAVLRRSAGELTTLHEEVALVEAYLAIEQERFEERLTARISMPVELARWKIPPLVIQPLVENAIKHGIAPLTAGGTVTVLIDTIRNGRPRPTLRVRVSDTGIGVSARDLARGREMGVGLNNIERRIQQYYRDGASLAITSEPGQGTTVELLVPQDAA